MSAMGTQTLGWAFSAHSEDENGLPVYSDAYSLKVGWAENYHRLASREYRSIGEEQSLAIRAQRSGRVLLHADGGSGKTAVLARLYRSVMPGAVVPVFMPIGRLNVSTELLKDSRVDPATQTVQAIVDLTAHQPVNLQQVLAEGQSVLLLVDELNDLPEASAELVLKLLERYTDLCPRVGVVVADRFTVRQRGREGFWRLATLLPMPLAGPNVRLPNGTVIPFLADLVSGVEDTPEAQLRHIPPALKRFLDDVFTDQTQLARLARFAFNHYVNSQSLYFSESSFKAALDEETIIVLRANALLRETSASRVAFSHQIVHDYLAALHIMVDPDLWNAATFDAVSSSGSKFDCVALGLVMLQGDPADISRASRYLERLYHWNLYACVYAISRARDLVPDSRHNGTEFAVLATIAERQWDVFNATRNRTCDALRLVNSDEARSLLGVGTINDLICFVEEKEYNEPRFRSWKAIFCYTADQAGDSLLSAMVADDSIIGWAAANVLKRKGTPETLYAEVRLLLSPEAMPDEAVRWRCVHALGASGADESMKVLVECLDTDSYFWVRYGAVRSLLEMAQRVGESTKVRTEVFEKIGERIPGLLKDDGLANELARCMLVDEGDDDWNTRCRRLLGSVWGQQTTRAGRERWKSVLNQVEETRASW